MKNLFILIAISTLFSCGGSKTDVAVVTKKVVCGDSVEQEMYDQNGQMFLVKVPGKCDTIIEKAAE